MASHALRNAPRESRRPASAATLAPLYARLGDFAALAGRLDSRGAFRNAWLATHVLGGEP